MGLKGILSLLGQAGKNLFSPKTQVRNLKSVAAFKRAQGMDVISPIPRQ